MEKGLRQAAEYSTDAGRDWEMEPTFRTIDEEILRHAENCVSIGLDHLRSLLAHHDHDGKDAPNTVWRRSWRDRLNTDIAALERSKSELRKSMGWED